MRGHVFIQCHVGLGDPTPQGESLLPWGEGGAPARRMREKCPADAPHQSPAVVLSGEDDRSRNISCDIILQFQSTPSVGRTTSIPCSASCIASNFNSRPPRGGRPLYIVRNQHQASISIHVLREEDDLAMPRKLIHQCYFNPRPPRGGRRTQCDDCRRNCNFNPRPP